MARKGLKTKRRTRAKTRVRGGGFSVNPANYVAVGHPVYQQYAVHGTDCPGGMSGGKRRMRRTRRTRGGYKLEVAPFMESDVAASVPVATAQVQAQPVAQGAAPQKGGRYEVNPGFLLDGESDMGARSYAPIAPIACERGHANSMNMHGGGSLAGAALAHYAPTAGYGHQFEASTGSLGGMMINQPYDARAMNPACIKTGGKRRMYRKSKRRGSRKSKRRST